MKLEEIKTEREANNEALRLYLNSASKEAIKKFVKDHNLAIDGVIPEWLWSNLSEQ